MCMYMCVCVCECIYIYIYWRYHQIKPRLSLILYRHMIYIVCHVYKLISFIHVYIYIYCFFVPELQIYSCVIISMCSVYNVSY